MRLPSTNPVTLSYGATSPPYSPSAPHAGTDYAGPDLNSYAPEEVIITAFYPESNYPSDPCGNQLDMLSMDGTRSYRFCHSSEVYAQVGQTYPEGTVLAKEGQVGLAYGVHLHFVMWVNGSRVDPDATIKSMIGENMPTQQQVLDHFHAYEVKGRLANGDPDQQQLDFYSSQAWSVLYLALLDYNHDRRNELEAQAGVKYTPVTETLYTKS